MEKRNVQETGRTPDGRTKMADVIDAAAAAFTEKDGEVVLDKKPENPTAK
jgi:hypothetical protein